MCSRFLPRAENFYDVKIEIISGRNQLIMSEEKPEEVRERIDDLLKQISRTDPKALEDGVHMKRDFRLCPECRSKVIGFLKL